MSRKSSTRTKIHVTAIKGFEPKASGIIFKPDYRYEIKKQFFNVANDNQSEFKSAGKSPSASQ